MRGYGFKQRAKEKYWGWLVHRVIEREINILVVGVIERDKERWVGC